MHFVLGQSHFVFDHLGPANGLSSGVVHCVFQDSRGFIWIGTANGLNRYDGRKTKVFRHNPKNPNSLINNRIQSLVEDKNGFLWIGTGNGISRLNLSTENIENFLPDEHNPNALHNGFLVNLCTDTQGQVWAGTHDGLYRYNPATNGFLYFHNPNRSKYHDSAKSNLVTHVFQDSKKRLWIVTFDGIFRFFPETNRFERYDTPPNQNTAYQIYGLAAGPMFEDHTGQLWYGTWDFGLAKFNPETRQSQFFSAQKPIVSIGESAINGQYFLWVNSSNGLAFFDRQKATFGFFSHNPDVLTSPAASNTNNFYTDRQGIFWFGVGEQGVDRLDPNKQIFSTQQFDKQVPIGAVDCILEEADALWIGGYYQNALFKFDKAGKLIRQWKNIPFDNPESSMVGDLYRDSDGFLWIATFRGLVRFDEKKNTATVFFPRLADSTLAFRLKRMVGIEPINEQELWVAFYKQGLARFNKQTGLFKTYQHDPTKPRSLPGKDIWAMLTDSKGTLWVSTNGGLARYDKATDDFTSYRADGKNGLLWHDLTGIAQDKKGQIWVTSTNGLYVLNPQTGQFSAYSTADGLPSDHLDDCCIDDTGNLWITTNQGLSVLDFHTHKFRNFYTTDGLPTNVLATIHKGLNGKIWLGGEQYLTHFEANKLPQNTAIPPVVITEMRILGEKTPLPLNNAHSEKQLILPYYQNSLSFEFSVLNFTNAFENSYFYQLDGFDNQWNNAEDGFVNYTNLDHGEYMFRVRGANNNGVLNPNGDTIKIVIEPPIWLTSWFLVSCISVLIGIGAFMYQRRINQITNDAAQKMQINKQIADLRMRALRTQMNPHFLFNSLNAIQECIITGQTDAALSYLAKFSKLVRLILEHSDKSLIPLSKELDVLRLYLDVEALRFSASFHYELQGNTHIDPSLINIPPMLVQPFVENAIWHGLLHKQGERMVKIMFTSDDDCLYVNIEDNGIGRAKATEYNTFHSKDHNSLGMKLIDERLVVWNETQPNRITCQVEDLFDNLGNPAGTRIAMSLPLL